jgi:hypothetical protein
MLFLVNQKFAESNTVKYHMEDRTTPSNYALQIKNLPQGLKEQELIKELYEHLLFFATKYKKIPKKDKPIFDISLAQQNEMIIANKKVKDKEDYLSYLYDNLKEKKYMKDINLAKKLDLNELKNVIQTKLNQKGKKHQNLQQFLTRNLDQKKAKKVLKKLVKYARLKKNAEEEREELRKTKNKITRAFVTFRTIQVKNFYVKAF